MKKLNLALIALALFGLQVSTAAVFSFNSGTTAVPTITLVTTNRASVYSVEVTCPNSSLVELFDCDSTADPYNGTNYVNSAYAGRTTYATNLVTTFVGYNGYTNYYTNSGIFSATNLVSASTNALSPLLSAVVSSGTYAVYQTDTLFARGIVARCSGTNTSVVINYRSGK